jgi:hypothetical protein
VLKILVIDYIASRYGSSNNLNDGGCRFRNAVYNIICTDFRQSLVGTALKGIQVYNNYHDRYSLAAITMASMMAQCSCVEFAILQVQEVVVNNPPSAYLLRSDAALTKHFSSVFGACELVFSILNQRLKSLTDGNVDHVGQLSKISKLKYVWNDQEMKDLLRNLESQASAINLLLAALQM